MEANTIKLKVGDKIIEVNSKIADMSDHIKELVALDATEVSRVRLRSLFRTSLRKCSLR
jgi:hypothetical protein